MLLTVSSELLQSQQSGHAPLFPKSSHLPLFLRTTRLSTTSQLALEVFSKSSEDPRFMVSLCSTKLQSKSDLAGMTRLTRFLGCAESMGVTPVWSLRLRKIYSRGGRSWVVGRFIWPMRCLLTQTRVYESFLPHPCPSSIYSKFLT